MGPAYHKEVPGVGGPLKIPLNFWVLVRGPVMMMMMMMMMVMMIY